MAGPVRILVFRKEVEMMSATAVTPEVTTDKANGQKVDDKAAFSLELSEQELLDEFGVLMQAEYTYGA